MTNDLHCSHTVKQINEGNKMETVEQFLARGGKIQTCRTGAKKRKKPRAQTWVVWDDLCQQKELKWELKDAIKQYDSVKNEGAL